MVLLNFLVMKRFLLLFVFACFTYMSYGQFLRGAFAKMLASSKFRIYCVDVNKRVFDGGKIVSEYPDDVITIKVYSNSDENEVVVTSETFGFTKTFKGEWYFLKNNIPMTTSEKSVNCLQECYATGSKTFLSYTRALEGLVMPMFQICTGDGYYYNFNVKYGEVYDSKTEKWVYGSVITEDPENDKVRMKLRREIGCKCADFDETLSDRLSIGSDPWN